MADTLRPMAGLTGPDPSDAAPPFSGRALPGNAWLCALVNQLACPGLGTLLAGQKVGFVQLILMLVGFGLVMLFMVMWFAATFRLASDLAWTEEQYQAQVRLWRWALWVGLGLCGLAWGWALASSIAIVRRSKETAAVQPHGNR